jgi:hypothetical protein
MFIDVAQSEMTKDITINKIKILGYVISYLSHANGAQVDSRLKDITIKTIEGTMIL